ncbi:hypothetical protein BDW02DRAFT_394664 [Decorospora gaudefroyi]|uniref:Uncharacterized protein n=1 Tax=Decorospora gaudefroyi TaxID=184978 RepID=A0A6A5KFE4_9PLEO|nr:hypothetical protein BDW02DRAFT_394664 [Decorospora gaudefroyi]
MAETPIGKLFASWNNLTESVNIEHLDSGVPHTTQWTKGQVEARFSCTKREIPPIACQLPGVGFPQTIAMINKSRNNDGIFLRSIQVRDHDWLARRLLVQKDFLSATHHTPHEAYFFIEQGELVLTVNGRPLTTMERIELEFAPGSVDLAKCQPAEVVLKKGLTKIFPPYTLYSFVAKKDSLVTTGYIPARQR